MGAMRRRVIMTAAALLVASGSLSAQESPAVAPSADSAAAISWGTALPATLVPPGSPHARSGEISTIQDGPPLVPVLFGIFGGIAGLFVADWWADQNCADSCGQPNIAALFLGGALGAMIGWLIGGGEIPEEPSPGRWP